MRTQAQTSLADAPISVRRGSRHLRAGRIGPGSVGRLGAVLALAGALCSIPVGVGARGVYGLNGQIWSDVQDKSCMVSFRPPQESSSEHSFISETAKNGISENLVATQSNRCKCPLFVWGEQRRSRGRSEHISGRGEYWLRYKIRSQR
jgi:hypothetical protein